MEQKWTHRAVGAGVGGIVMLFGFRSVPAGNTVARKDARIRGSHECAPCAMREAVLANPAAVAELKVKRLSTMTTWFRGSPQDNRDIQDRFDVLAGHAEIARRQVERTLQVTEVLAVKV